MLHLTTTDVKWMSHDMYSHSTINWLSSIVHMYAEVLYNSLIVVHDLQKEPCHLATKT